MEESKKIIVRCRAVIIHEGKMLVVKHAHDASFTAFPGGKLEYGEGVVECMERELTEELGVRPDVGRLLYVRSFINTDGVQSIEFFFEIKNGADYTNTEELARTHAHEISEIIWVDKNNNLRILPEQIANDFKTDKILSNETRIVKN